MKCQVCGRDLVLFDDNDGWPFGYICPAWEAYYSRIRKAHPTEDDLVEIGFIKES